MQLRIAAVLGRREGRYLRPPLGPRTVRRHSPSVVAYRATSVDLFQRRVNRPRE